MNKEDRHYEANIAVTSRPFDGMEACVRSLKDRGHRIGICTNKPEHLSRKLIGELGLTDLFPVILGADSRPWRKPDPRHLTDTIEQLGGRADNAVLVGDSDTDSRTARAANIPVILVSFGYTETPRGRPCAACPQRLTCNPSRPYSSGPSRTSGRLAQRESTTFTR